MRALPRAGVFGLLLSLLVLASSGGTHALLIQVTPDAGLAANAPALAAVARAAAQWEQAFTDPIAVNVDASFANLGAGGFLGQTSLVFLYGTYTQVRDQLVADSAADLGDAVVTALPSAAGFEITLPTGLSWDGDVGATKANLKAMGFTGLDASFGASDASIVLNSESAFDFDSSDGVGFGLLDFEAVMAHEIGHVLGFFSSVDAIDAAWAAGTVGSISIAPLDLFRFAASENPDNATEFSSLARNLVPGTAAVFDDAGLFELALSTGVQNGDGRQASHWRDDEFSGSALGLMDPTLFPGRVLPVGDADRRALDVIGWDLVPEPSSAALLGLGLAWLAGRRRGN